MNNTILDDMITDIKSGRYKDHERLPSTSVLASLYKVPRIEARKVYEKLENMGYIYSYQGRGHYLRKKTEAIELVLSGDESFTVKMSKLGKDMKTENIECTRIAYNEKIYNELNADKYEEIYKISRLRIIDNEPIAIHISYIRKNIFPKIYEDGINIQSIFNYYHKNGFNTFISSKKIITIDFPTQKERKLLNCNILVPMIKLESNCIDRKSDNILEYTETFYRGDKFKYKL